MSSDDHVEVLIEQVNIVLHAGIHTHITGVHGSNL